MASSLSMCVQSQARPGAVFKGMSRSARQVAGQKCHLGQSLHRNKVSRSKVTLEPSTVQQRLAFFDKVGEPRTVESLKEKYDEKRKEILEDTTWPADEKEVVLRVLDKYEAEGKDLFSMGLGELISVILETLYLELCRHTGKEPDMRLLEVVKGGFIYWAGLSLAMPAILGYTCTLGAHVPWTVMEPVTWGLYLGVLTRWNTLFYIPTLISTTVLSKVQNQEQPKVCSGQQLGSELAGIGKLVAVTTLVPLLFHWTDAPGALHLTEGLLAGWVLAELCRVGGFLLAGAKTLNQ